VVVISVVITIMHMAPLARFFKLMAALLRLLAVFAVLAHGLFQVLFGLADVITALVIAVGMGGRCQSGQ